MYTKDFVNKNIPQYLKYPNNNSNSNINKNININNNSHRSSQLHIQSSDPKLMLSTTFNNINRNNNNYNNNQNNNYSFRKSSPNNFPVNHINTYIQSNHLSYDHHTIHEDPYYHSISSKTYNQDINIKQHPSYQSQLSHQSLIKLSSQSNNNNKSLKSFKPLQRTLTPSTQSQSQYHSKKQVYQSLKIQDNIPTVSKQAFQKKCGFGSDDVKYNIHYDDGTNNQFLPKWC